MRKSRKKKTPHITPPLKYAAAAVDAQDGHVDLSNREALQQLIKEESDKRIVKPQEVKSSTGDRAERWKLAAEAELSNNFVNMGAFHVTTDAERRAFGRPLPMLCVWSVAGALDYYKCRVCVCGNFADVDPTQQSWTAQAEPSSLLSAIKLGRNKGWMMSKHDVK